MASRPRTRTDNPSTDTISQVVTPIRLGRPLARWAKMPTRGQSVLFARMPRPRLDLRLVDEVKDVHHFEMAELREAGGDVRAELRGVEFDRRFDVAPVVVDRLGPSASDVADGRDGEGHATKYLACGWWQMTAEVVCSGWYWNDVSSLHSTPMRSASSRSPILTLSSRSGHAGYPNE